MPTDARLILLSNIDYFTAQLENGHLTEGRVTATRLLLADARLRWGYLEMQAAAREGRPCRAINSPSAPTVPTARAANPPGGQFPSAYAEALRPLLASLSRLPGRG
jgi:hypothetical protein